MPKFKWEILGDFQTMCDLEEVKKLINEFLPFVANADKIQNEQTKEWSDKEAWEALALLGVEVGVVGVEGLQTRTRSLAITSVASKSKKVLKAEGRHKDRADSNSRWIAKMLPSTVESLHSCNKKSNINFYFFILCVFWPKNYSETKRSFNGRANIDNYSKSILTLFFVEKQVFCSISCNSSLIPIFFLGPTDFENINSCVISMTWKNHSCYYQTVGVVLILQF